MTKKRILTNFKIRGEVKKVESLGNGHINKTFLVTTLDGDITYQYVFQNINHSIFKDIELLMENILKVTRHLKAKIKEKGGDHHRETMNLILTKDDKTIFYDKDTDSYWRIFLFVDNTICLDKVECEEDFVKVATSFGNFLNLLNDFPSSTIKEVIPDFHDTYKRYLAFLDALDSDPLDRKKDILNEINFIIKRKEDTKHLVDLLAKGDLPLRVTHNDTKLNNILLDKDTKEGICVIDLDTVMPGLAMYDFGDSIRFGANDCEEDEIDLNKVNFSVPLFEAFTKGYLNVTKDTLTPLEKENLVWGAKIITLECGIRFLSDYLLGDTYFKTTRENQNLDRARVQFKLVQDIEEHWDELNNIVKKYS